MELVDIKKCIVCNSKDIKILKKIIKCNDCGSKIGILNGKIWYEYIIDKEEKEN